MEGATRLPPEAWDALVDPNDPFLEHGFLSALERSGSVGGKSGWSPQFVVAHAGGRLVGAIPLYIKEHSYGEFIFDWAWANAAHRGGIRYYPKLVAAVPFTPATGQRLLVHPDATSAGERDAIVAALLDAAAGLARATGASSTHVLFCPEDETAALEAAGYAPRLSLQFHWANRAPDPYRDFGDYLDAFRSRNRKQVRKEREIAAGHGLRIETRTGEELGPREWAALELFYRTNIDKHDNVAYLTPEFFVELRQRLAHRVVATLAFRGDEPVAGTLNFERGRHLYGRYWGCLEEREMLHFELCYYRLIERAIERGHTRFEAGAQGEHKLKRGLLPAFTHSAHWIRDPDLRRAVGGYLRQERQLVLAQRAEYAAGSPFARGD